MPALQRNWESLVERSLFIPDTIWTQEEPSLWYVPVCRQDDPGRWQALVAADEPVITQVEYFQSPDGEARPGHATSSSSAPWIMNRMLDAMDLQPGMRVLEIGAGTGWNAAIMTAAGAEVTTVEIDQDLAVRARAALERAGYGKVTVICGDGELGAPEHAPYQRIIASAAAHTVPYHWVEQSDEGGRIVFPYTGQHHRAGLAVLTVHEGIATGQIVGESGYMPLRGQRMHPMEQAKLTYPDPGVTVRITVTPDGQQVTTEPAPGTPGTAQEHPASTGR